MARFFSQCRGIHSRIALLALLLIGGCPAAVCAASQMLFTQLGADENLSQGSVLAIVQDTKGYLWFGTEDGLNRFDGYDVEHITRGGDAGAGLWLAARATPADNALAAALTAQTTARIRATRPPCLMSSLLP